MKLKVSNDLVLKNVECFKLYLKRYAETIPPDASSVDMKIQAFVHANSGEVIFSEPNYEPGGGKFWQKVTFHFFSVGDKKSRASVELQKSEEGIGQASLDARAQFVFSETIKTMQTIGRLLPSSQARASLLKEYSKVHLELVEHLPLHNDVIHAAWHQMSRKDAEKALHRSEVGTFLFRKDEYASILESQLCKAHKTEVKCVTLSYVDLHRNVCEYTLVKTYHGWLTYQGDPSLDETVFPTIDAFLDNMKGVLKQPLLHV